MNYTPKDQNSNGIPDGAEQKASGAKYDSVKEAYRSKNGLWKGAGEVLKYGRKTLAGENTAGKIGGRLKDIATRFGILPKWMNETTDQIGNSLKSKQTNKPMLSKILSVKNFINMEDENGNFSLQELGASLLQIVLAGAIVYGAIELGIWNELIEVLGDE